MAKGIREVSLADNSPGLGAEEFSCVHLENTSHGHYKFYDIVIMHDPADGEYGAYHVQGRYGRIDGSTCTVHTHLVCFSQQTALEEARRVEQDKLKGGYELTRSRVTVDARRSFRRPEPKPLSAGDCAFYSVVGKNLAIDFNLSPYFEGKYLDECYAVTNLVFSSDKEFVAVLWAKSDAVPEAARRHELLAYVVSFMSSRGRALLRPYAKGTPYAEIMVNEDAKVLQAIREQFTKIGSNPLPPVYAYMGIRGTLLKTHSNTDNIVPISRKELRDMLYVKKAIRLLEV